MENKNSLNKNEIQKIDWEKIQLEMKNKFGKDIFESWLRKIDFSEEFNNYILLSVSTRFLRDWITSRYLDQILQIVKSHKQEINRIEILINENKNSFNNNNTFRYMFLQACNKVGLDFDLLNKKFSYSFVLQHPDNRIVVPFNEMKLYLINIYSFNNDIINLCNNAFNSVLYDLNNTNIDTPNIFNKKDMDINNFYDLINYVDTKNLNYKINIS